jgi:putative addiction module component (TIGR02574 family)
MDIQAEQILQSALNLQAGERAEIAATLLRSLHDKPDDVLDPEWAEEIKRRIESIDKGEVQLIPWEDVMRSMRERLNG